MSAWHSYAILGLLLIFAAAIIGALRVFAGTNLPTLPIGVNLLVLGLAGLGTLLLILRAYTLPSASGFWCFVRRSSGVATFCSLRDRRDSRCLS